MLSFIKEKFFIRRKAYCDNSFSREKDTTFTRTRYVRKRSDKMCINIFLKTIFVLIANWDEHAAIKNYPIPFYH